METALNATGEWENVVAENHRRAEDQALLNDLHLIQGMIREDTSGADRAAIAKHYGRKISRGQAVMSGLMAICALVAMIVLMGNRIPEAAMPAVLIGLLAAGIMIGAHLCAWIIRKEKHNGK